MVNSLSPGPVEEPRIIGVFQREALATGTTTEFVKQQELSRAALQRMVSEDEIAPAVISMRNNGQSWQYSMELIMISVKSATTISEGSLSAVDDGEFH
jgi:NAD(P)-dependent dehydrogenase (short-subunit alcohol dehydrogenase family)